jgi:hypothetical protein
MDRVGGKDTGLFVLWIVFLEKLHKGPSEIAQRYVQLRSDVPADCSVLVEHDIQFVGTVVPLSDDTGGAQYYEGAAFQDLTKKISEPTLEFAFWGPLSEEKRMMPYIIDSDVYHDKRWMPGKDVTVNAVEKIWDSVPPGACTDDIGTRCRHGAGKRVSQQRDVATRLIPLFCNGVAEEDDPVSSGGQFVEAVAGGKEQAQRKNGCDAGVQRRPEDDTKI